MQTSQFRTKLNKYSQAVGFLTRIARIFLLMKYESAIANWKLIVQLMF